jgi:ribosomal protein S13
VIKRTITCDHCGKETKDTVEMALPYGFRPAEYVPDYVHGCSKEHLGFALAKAFGISLDGKTIARIADLEAQLAGEIRERQVCQGNMRELEKRFSDTEAVCGHLRKERDLAEIERDAARGMAYQAMRTLREARDFAFNIIEQKTLVDGSEYVAINAKHLMERFDSELEKRLVPPVVDGKTPGVVAREAWYGEDEPDDDAGILVDWENAAQAVLRAFGGDMAREALRRVRVDIAQRDVRKEHGQMATDMALAIIDDELASLEGQGITDPQKPTRPADITDTQKPTKPALSNRLDTLATYWERGMEHLSLTEDYRRGLKDCAKELREELDK